MKSVIETARITELVEELMCISVSNMLLMHKHGDAVAIVYENEEILNSYSYDAFGNIEEQEETMDNPYRYVGYD